MCLKSLFRDRKFQVPRIWSNNELKKFAPLFEGNVVNVSAWKDSDKDGGFYRNYFTACQSYSITNYKESAMGFQGKDGEIFLDLTSDLPQELTGKFDVVFNHTTLEHIYEVHKAMENICSLSSDIVIIVAPFLQQMHADFGDYWRFTPTCIQKMMEQNGLKVIYLNFNSNIDASTYIFAIGTKKSDKWKNTIKSNLTEDGVVKFTEKPWIKDQFTPMTGSNSVMNIGGKIGYYLNKIAKK